MYMYIYVYGDDLPQFQSCKCSLLITGSTIITVIGKSVYMLYNVQYTNSYGKIDRYDRYISISIYIYIYVIYVIYIYIYIYIYIANHFRYGIHNQWGMDVNTKRPRTMQTFFVLSVIISATERLTGDFHKSEVKCFLSLAHRMW